MTGRGGVTKKRRAAIVVSAVGGLAAILGVVAITGAAITGAATTPGVASAGGYDAPDITLTHVGGQAPRFKVKTLGGDTIDPGALHGRPLLLNFWATWCGPCQIELPELERLLWHKYKGRGLAMVAIARKQSESDIAGWGAQHRLTMPFAADPKNLIYSQYATEGIPRTYVIGADGTILFQSVGYSPDDITRMDRMIGDALDASARP